MEVTAARVRLTEPVLCIDVHNPIWTNSDMTGFRCRSWPVPVVKDASAVKLQRAPPLIYLRFALDFGEL